MGMNEMALCSTGGNMSLNSWIYNTVVCFQIMP